MGTIRPREGTRTMAKVACHVLFGTGLTMHLVWARQGRKADGEVDLTSDEGGSTGDGDEAVNKGHTPANPATNEAITPGSQANGGGVSANVGATPGTTGKPQGGGSATPKTSSTH